MLGNVDKEPARSVHYLSLGTLLLRVLLAVAVVGTTSSSSSAFPSLKGACRNRAMQLPSVALQRGTAATFRQSGLIMSREKGMHSTAAFVVLLWMSWCGWICVRHRRMMCGCDGSDTREVALCRGSTRQVLPTVPLTQLRARLNAHPVVAGLAVPTDVVIGLASLALHRFLQLSSSVVECCLCCFPGVAGLVTSAPSNNYEMWWRWLVFC